MTQLGHLAVLTLIVIGAPACATKKLWDLTDERPVAIRQDRVTEKEIQDRGLRYTKDDRAGVYRVEKTRGQRAVDWAVRMSVTPATLLVDSIATIPILVIYGVKVFADSGAVVQSGSGGKIVDAEKSGARGPDESAAGPQTVGR